MNPDVFQNLDEVKDQIEELIYRTHPDEQSIPGATLHERLKVIHRRLLKIETAMFLSFPKETKDELLSARKKQE
jgi:hypothetical protein